MIPWLFVIVLLAGMVIHITLGLYSRRFKARPVQLPFEVLMYICAIWCATFIFDISTDGLALKIILMQVRYIGVSFITLVLLRIAIFFTGHGSWLTKRRLALLLVIPVTTVVLELTTQYSTLFRHHYTHLCEIDEGMNYSGQKIYDNVDVAVRAEIVPDDRAGGRVNPSILRPNYRKDTHTGVYTLHPNSKKPFSFV